jgi:DNA-binding response OmpR family regulator
MYFGAPTDDPAGSSATDAIGSMAGPSRRRVIVLIEDNPGDVRLVRESLQEHCVDCELLVLGDGEKATRYIEEMERSDDPCPALLVLDLNLPKRNGREVLRRVREGSRCSDVPVVVLTSSAAEQDKMDVAALGATQYIRKPLDLEEFMNIGSMLKAFLSGPPKIPT